MPLAGVGIAAPKVESVEAVDSPKCVAVRGDFLHGVKFTGKNGTNYLLFSKKAAVLVREAVRRGLGRCEEGAPGNLLPVRDFITTCELGGVSARFHDAALTVAISIRMESRR